MTDLETVIVIVAFASVLLWLWFAPLERQVAAVAGLYEVPLTAETTPLLERAIRWARRWRVIGAVVASIVASLAFGTRLNLLAIAIGIAVGGILAEITRRRPPTGSVRGASLARRSVSDYVRRPVLVVVGVLYVVLLGATAMTTSVAERDRDAIALSSIVAAIGLSTIAIAQYVARRPIPGDGAAVLVDHVIRSASIMSVIGSGAAVIGLAISRHAIAASKEDLPGVVRYLNTGLMVVGGAALALGIALTFRSLPRRGAYEAQA